MMLGMQFCGFASVVRRMLGVALGRVRVMCGCFMVPSLMMLTGFTMVFRGVVVMLGGLAVMVRSFLGHCKSPCST